MASSARVAYHDRDCAPNTNVMQGAGLITDVKKLDTLGDRLKAAREALGLSQEDVAAAAGVRQGTIGNIEANTRKNPRELLAIAKAVGVSPDWLKTGDAPAPAAGSVTTVGEAVTLVAKSLAALPQGRRRTIAQLAAEHFADAGETDIASQIDALAPGVKMVLPTDRTAASYRDHAFRLAEANPDPDDRDRLTRFIREVDLFITASAPATSVTLINSREPAERRYSTEG